MDDDDDERPRAVSLEKTPSPLRLRSDIEESLAQRVMVVDRLSRSQAVVKNDAVVVTSACQRT
jgi:hypothetical protein